MLSAHGLRQESRGSTGSEGRKCPAQSSLTRQAAYFLKEDNQLRSPARRDALGRRARGAVPDSRAEVSGAQARSARSPSEQGRRHLVVKSQVKR